MGFQMLWVNGSTARDDVVIFVKKLSVPIGENGSIGSISSLSELIFFFESK